MPHQIIKGFERFIGKNTTVILTGVAITGVVITVILAVEETKTAIEIIEDQKCTTKLEKVKAVWKCYFPATISGLVTIGSIISLNSVHQKRTAALAGLYSLTQTALSEYREKVVEIIGENKERKIRDEIDSDRIANNPATSIIVTGSGDVLCYDSITGRYFISDIEKIKQTVNELNRRLLTEMFISLNELYYELGLEPTEIGNGLGFDIEHGLFEIKFSSQLTKEGKPCLVLNYEVHPQYK